MRTTLNLNDQLLSQLKKLAVETHCTLTSVIEDNLRFALFKREQLKDRPKIKLPTFKGDGLRPGISLDNNASLLDAMDDPNDPFRR